MGRHHINAEQAADLVGRLQDMHHQHELAGGGPRRGDRRARGGFGGPPPWMGPGMAEALRGFGGRGGPGHRGGPRARRGDVRAAILDLLSQERESPLNGYQVIQEIAERTEQAWKPSPGSVYPTVQQLEDEGLVRTEEEGGRKVLLLTDAGRTYVEGHPEEMAAVWAPFAEEGSSASSKDLKKGLGEMMGAVWQVAATGSPAQVEQAVEVLAETRRRLYTILAEGDQT